jgi:hypothetical protein
VTCQTADRIVAGTRPDANTNCRQMLCRLVKELIEIGRRTFRERFIVQTLAFFTNPLTKGGRLTRCARPASLVRGNKAGVVHLQGATL